MKREVKKKLLPRPEGEGICVSLSSRCLEELYLWSGLLAIQLLLTTLAAIVGYFLRWHEPYWMMSVFLGVLGFLSGLSCSSFLLTIRGLPVLASLRRTRVK